MLLLFSIGTSRPTKPIELTTKTSEVSALILKTPALSVIVALVVPFTVTVAPAIGLFEPSKTVPLTVCEYKPIEKRIDNRKRKQKRDLPGGKARIVFFFIVAIR